MDITADIAKVKELLDKARDVLIVTHEHPTHDSVGSTLALYLGFKGMGKNVTIACPDPITVELSNYVGANKMVTELSRKNFIISLDYVDGSIEKVSYNIEGNKFNLVIEPRPGFDAFSEDKVSFSHAGASADVIITVDTIHLGGLKKLYEGDKELYASKAVINVDRHPNNAQYGQVNLVDTSASSTAEVVGRLLSSLGVALTVDIATNILNALFAATNSFQNPNVSANAFELAGVCMKAGAKRFEQKPSMEEVPTGETVAPPRPGAEAGSVGAPQPVQRPVPPPATTQPAAGQAPADWLKPKIFKSSNLV